MAVTPRRGFTLLDADQPGAEVIENTNWLILDVLLGLTIQDDALNTPPGSPAEGQLWVVGSTPTGAWTGQAGKYAAWLNGAWVFINVLRGDAGSRINSNSSAQNDWRRYNGTAWEAW